MKGERIRAKIQYFSQVVIKKLLISRYFCNETDSLILFFERILFYRESEREGRGEYVYQRIFYNNKIYIGL